MKQMIMYFNEKIKYKEIFDPTLFKTDTILHKPQDVRILTINIFILFLLSAIHENVYLITFNNSKINEYPAKIIDPAKFLFF